MSKKMSKKMSFPITLWNLFITFDLRLEISKGFLEMKLSLISQPFLIESFLKKIILLCLNMVWNSNCNKISMFYMSHMDCFTSYHPTCRNSLTFLLYILKVSDFWSKTLCILYGILYMVYCIWHVVFDIIFALDI